MNMVAKTEDAKYLGFTIEPKRDFSPDEKARGVTGYVITDGFCNVMPGATWARTIEEAELLIHCFLLSGGHKPDGKFSLYEGVNGDKFWELVSL